jgi:hypothetical protein
MTGPSAAVRRFRFRLVATASIRRFLRTPGDVLTIVSLGLLFAGLAMVAVPLALVVTGSLLVLLTPVGAAIRILLRGR